MMSFVEWNGLLVRIEQKLSTKPEIKGHSRSCCIYRAPTNLMDTFSHRGFYQPQIVSIGPYYHGLPHLQMMEEHKWSYLSLLLDRIQTKNSIPRLQMMEDLLKKIASLESQARDCYSEAVKFKPCELIEILVLDGCFIIELFRRLAGSVPFEEEDPLRSMAWIYASLLRDLIRLENQIPYFVLDCLFKITQLPGEESEAEPIYCTLKFFRYICKLHSDDSVFDLDKLESGFVLDTEFHSEDTDYTAQCQFKHILDILRNSFTGKIEKRIHGYGEVEGESRVNIVACCWPMQSHTRASSEHRIPHLIHCVSKLRRAGISIKSRQENNFLNIKYSHGVIYMPKIALDEFMREFLVNCVAYEQCHSNRRKPMSNYVGFLDCLINTSSDVEYLCEKDIIDNYLGSDEEAAKFINDLGKNVRFEMGYLETLYVDVNKYYKKERHVQWATFKDTYFSSPWSFISAVAAFILLVLTVISTVYTILAYNKN